MTDSNLAEEREAAETAPQTTPAPGSLIVPRHGHGRLMHGNPGNKGGGAPPSKVRAALRRDFVRRRHVLRDIADDPEAKPGERVKALDVMARYGLGTESQMTVVSADVQDRLQRTVALILSRPEWTSEELVKQLEGVWR